jgi:Lon protease-like protein
MAEQLPLFPLNTVLFPGMPLPLHIFEERYRRLLRIRKGKDVVFGVTLIKSGNATGGPVDMHPIGTAARLVSIHSFQDGRADIIVSGINRFRIHMVNWSAGYCVADVTFLDDESPASQADATALLERAARKFSRYVEGITRVTGRTFSGITISDDPAEASWDLTTRLPLHTWERQRMLEIDTPEARLLAVMKLIDRENALLFKGGAAGLTINHPGGRFSAN